MTNTDTPNHHIPGKMTSCVSQQGWDKQMPPCQGPGQMASLTEGFRGECRIRILLINSLLVRTKEMGVPFCKERKKEKRFFFEYNSSSLSESTRPPSPRTKVPTALFLLCSSPTCLHLVPPGLSWPLPSQPPPASDEMSFPGRVYSFIPILSRFPIILCWWPLFLSIRHLITVSNYTFIGVFVGILVYSCLIFTIKLC